MWTVMENLWNIRNELMAELPNKPKIVEVCIKHALDELNEAMDKIPENLLDIFMTFRAYELTEEPLLDSEARTQRLMEIGRSFDLFEEDESVMNLNDDTSEYIKSLVRIRTNLKAGKILKELYPDANTQWCDSYEEVTRVRLSKVFTPREQYWGSCEDDNVWYDLQIG